MIEMGAGLCLHPFLMMKGTILHGSVINMSAKGKYSGKSKIGLTNEEIKKKHKQEDGDGYLFDVEYEKLKKEREEAEREYKAARDEYYKITEELRQEMANGTASETDMARFMAILSERGVQLQQQQEQMQKEVEKATAQVADVEDRMDELRMKAFGGNTRAWNPGGHERDYKGFNTESGKKYAEAKLVEMSPIEYLRRVAFDVKGKGMDELLNSASPAQVEKYMRQMLRGTRFNAPGLNYKNGTTTGDTRVLAALMNGYGRIPVFVIE